MKYGSAYGISECMRLKSLFASICSKVVCSACGYMQQSNKADSILAQKSLDSKGSRNIGAGVHK